MMQSAMRRIFAAGADGASSSVWVPLAVRLITRGLQLPQGDEDGTEHGESLTEARGRQEALREVIYDFVVEDVGSR